ncbi:MAG TPA: hypothetical protein VJ824_03905 [Bacillota bacterium]|nr:hypothetical protein [Bacillota bacterium]
MNKKKVLSFVTTGMTIVALTSSAFAATASSTTPAISKSHQQHHPQGSFASQELLDLLHVDSQTLHNELKAGKSLADIAATNGVSEQSVIDYFVKKSTDRIQKDVQAGKITQEQADKRIAQLPKRMQKFVEHKGGSLGGHHGHHKGHPSGSMKVVAEALGLSQDDLKTQLKSGKSIAELAAEQGKDTQQIIDLMVKQATQKIDQAVQEGKLTQEKADQIKAKLPERMKKMVERKGYGSKKQSTKE